MSENALPLVHHFWSVLEGDCRETLRTLDAGSVQTCVTSPPYHGLRDYGHEGQIGLEATPEDYVAELVGVFQEVRRVLADDGTVWLNIGDSYVDRANAGRARSVSGGHSRHRGVLPAKVSTVTAERKPKDLLGLPWMVAFALRADGWYLRSEIIWAKRNGLPDGRAAYDRPDRSHEHIFLLSKRDRYYYDGAAIREDSDPEQDAHNQRYAREYEAHTDRAADTGQPGNVNHIGIHSRPGPGGRNKRSVWRESVARFEGAHFAVFPPKLIEPCILAGSREGDTVLDPFAGAGTTGVVSLRRGRSFIGCELNPDYVRLARDRIIADAPLMNAHSEAVA